MEFPVGDPMVNELDDLACLSRFLSKAISDLDFSAFSAHEQRGAVVVADTLAARIDSVASSLGTYVYNQRQAEDAKTHAPAAPILTEPMPESGRQKRTA